MLENAIKTKVSPHQERTEQKIIPKVQLQSFLNESWKYVGAVRNFSTVTLVPNRARNLIN